MDGARLRVSLLFVTLIACFQFVSSLRLFNTVRFAHQPGTNPAIVKSVDGVLGVAPGIQGGASARLGFGHTLSALSGRPRWHFIDIAGVGTRLQMSSGNDEGEEEEAGFETNMEVDEEGVVYRKSKKTGIPFTRAKADNRDNLPFKTYIMLDGKARNAELIATLRLGALTACGDLLDLGDKGMFEVVRVSFVYKWNVTGFVVTGKRLYCKPAKSSWAKSSLQ